MTDIDDRGRNEQGPISSTSGPAPGSAAQCTGDAPKRPTPEPAPGAADGRARNARAGPAGTRETLESAIEAERLRLLQAHAVLRCLYDVLLYRDDEDSVVHAETADVALSLISDSIDHLDGVRLRPLIEAAKRPALGTRNPGASQDRVEDAQRRYLC